MKTKSKNIIFIGLAIFFLFAVVIYVTGNLKDRYFNLYVHKGLFFLLDKEFRSLLSRYGQDNKVATFKQDKVIGVLVKYPIHTADYGIQLRLSKNTESGVFLLRAEVASSAHWDTGNPPVFIDIPAEHLNAVTESGLTDEQIARLLETAKRVAWRPIGINETVELKSPIILDYKGQGR